jgi:LPXTG-site transpeptidase (sortase) family protein
LRFYAVARLSVKTVSERRVKRRCAEFILLFGGVCLLSKGVWNVASYHAFQSHPEWFQKTSSQQSSRLASSPALLPVTLHSSNNLENLTNLHVLGKLEVVRLGMSVLVIEGDDEKQLGLAAGHLSGTAALGEKGNAVIAGHRDSAFWPLRKIRVGDRVRLRAAKTYEYVVNSVRVVSPDDVSVLQGGNDKRALTLVTCYPFRYFGTAPKRFIVQATIPHT